MPGCPELAAWTASIAKARIAFANGNKVEPADDPVASISAMTIIPKFYLQNRKSLSTLREWYYANGIVRMDRLFFNLDNKLSTAN
jgi:hypothetical protein